MVIRFISIKPDYDEKVTLLALDKGSKEERK